MHGTVAAMISVQYQPSLNRCHVSPAIKPAGNLKLTVEKYLSQALAATTKHYLRLSHTPRTFRHGARRRFPEQSSALPGQRQNAHAQTCLELRFSAYPGSPTRTCETWVAASAVGNNFTVLASTQSLSSGNSTLANTTDAFWAIDIEEHWL